MNINFKKYYLSNFVVFLILFLLISFFAKSPTSFIANVGICICAALILSPIVGSASYYVNEVWLPKFRKSSMSKPLFQELMSNGFLEKDSVLIGTVRDYTVSISIEKEQHKYLQVKVIFEHIPDFNKYQAKRLMKMHNKSKWHENITLWWRPGFVFYDIPIFFRFPKYSIVTQKIDELIDMLKKEGFKPGF